MGTEKQLLTQLSSLRDSTILIVGLGNTLKGDDAVGPLVIEQLQSQSISADLIDAGTVPENYIQTIIKKAPNNLIVIDAIDFKAPTGTIQIFKPEEINSHVISTHVLSPRLFVDMVCRDIKLDVYFIGVQPARMQIGQPVSPEVDGAIQKLSQILTEAFPLRK
ncbi:MAG: hydrogenase maturation protease [Phycisphaerales bacterium]|jgi:hydrogenase 3 maturation protease